MGASLVYLDEPNKNIEWETGEDRRATFACGEMQGWRLNMVSRAHKRSHTPAYFLHQSRIKAPKSPKDSASNRFLTLLFSYPPFALLNYVLGRCSHS